MIGARTFLDHDWYAGGIPANVAIGRDVYIDTAYSFAPFDSELDPGLSMGEASGAYDRSAFVVGPRGRVDVGPFTCLNGTYLICEDRIAIGAHCLLAWGVVVTDSWLGPNVPLAARRAAMRAAAADPARRPPVAGRPRPVTIEDNVWVGFGAVVLPGVTLGTGSVVGCKAVVADDVPPYAVVAGDPARVIRHLDPVDHDALAIATGPAR